MGGFLGCGRADETVSLASAKSINDGVCAMAILGLQILVPGSPVDPSVASWIGSDRDYEYQELLNRFYVKLNANNQDLVVKKRHTMKPPQVMRIGTSKTLWANFSEICQL